LLQRSAFLALLVLGVSACSGLGRLSNDSEAQSLWAQRQAAVAAVGQWDMYARGALRLEGEAYHIGIRWQREADDRFMMLLEAPFGQGVLRIDAAGPGRYRLLLPDGRMFENSSAEALLEDVVGWSLPIGGLDYWVRGLPHPRGDYRHRLDADGRAAWIHQDGWDIDYLDYFSEAGAPPLPRRLLLKNETLTLRLAIERWQPSQDEAGDADLFPSFN
jgi:outer membrane lipoprotein LolB